MKFKLPLNLSEALAAIAELQTATNWLQGQNNLLLGFITSSPDNRKNFARFLKSVAESNSENIEEMKMVARGTLHYFADCLDLQQPQKTQSPGHEPSRESLKSPEGSNVIQFPNPPKPPNA